MLQRDCLIPRRALVHHLHTARDHSCEATDPPQGHARFMAHRPAP